MIERLCPVCGCATEWRLECPGYPSIDEKGKQTVMVCVPACGNATEFFCLDDACGWWYRYPNHRDVDKMGRKPEWMDEVLAEMWWNRDE